LDNHPSQFKKRPIFAKFEDIEELMEGNLNEPLILDLACGLSLCKPTQPWEEGEPKFLPFSYRYVAYAHWHKDYSLAMKEIYGLQQGSTVPLVRRLRAQGMTISLPPSVSNGTEIAIALAFPINPSKLGVKNK
jgi:hypothetical protein